MEKVLFSWSGGKDSALGLYEILHSEDYEVASLLTTITEDYDRVSLHGVRRVLIEQQAHTLGLPLTEVFIPKDCTNGVYEARMRTALAKFKQNGVSRVAFGDIFLEDIRRYREDNLAELGITGLFPLWGRDSAALIRSFVTLGFEAITTCIDSKVLDAGFLGRKIDRQFLADFPPQVDPAGENGEFHSFVFSGPIFRERVAFKPGERVSRDSFWFCDLLPLAVG
jgi:uncharacterized protein (TIGR00290 family)